jgi:type III restriction enzyme
MSDFSLMDAIECGIVKLPRVPVADNIPGGEAPIFRNLWEHIRAQMPRKGRGKAGKLDPLDIPTALQTALEALYGHHSSQYGRWAFAEFTEVYQIEVDFAAKVEAEFNKMIESVTAQPVA